MKQIILKCLFVIALIAAINTGVTAQTPAAISVTNNNTVHIINWTDAIGLTGEIYNVYLSESMITNVADAGVFLIGTAIVEGSASYEYQLYTPDPPGGDDVTYYYAVTVVSEGVEKTTIIPAKNATSNGEAGTTTWGLAMTWVDGTVYSPPVLDGDMSDWAPFNVYLEPDFSGMIPSQFDDVDDCSGYLYVAADEEAFYFGADIDDDRLEHNIAVTNFTMWQGDVVEYYLGVYDLRPSENRHEFYHTSPEPDFQIDVKSNAGTDPCMCIYTSNKIPTLGFPTASEQWCGPRIPGDLTSGRYMEVKLPYSELEWDPLNQPVPRPKIGWVLPCNMMISDTDTPGSGAREGQLSWSNDENAGSSWCQPDVWKHQVVIYDPKQLVPGTSQATGISVTNHETVHVIHWDDASALMGESYNVYMSGKPITNVNGFYVYLIGTGIVEGAGSYEYQLYHPGEGGYDVTYYYAVTSVSDGVENATIIPANSATLTGEPGVTTWGVAMVWVNKEGYYPPPVPDGDMDDWPPFSIYLDPTSPETNIYGEFDDANDCCGYLYCAADENAFYFGADIDDDCLENIYPVTDAAMWKGDVVEYYIGVYDMRPSENRHGFYHTSPNPDFQINVKSNAGTDPCMCIYTGGIVPTRGFPTTTEQWCGPRIPGDLSSGRISEVKLPYAELEWDPLNQPVPRPKIGWVLPFNVMINDTDTPGSGDREGQLSWSTHDSAGVSWRRPDVWKHQVVIYDLGYVFNSVEQPRSAELPGDYGLDQNYPNPFNTGTTIRYQLSGNSQVTLTIYNLMGQEVRTLVNANQPAGFYAARWDGSDKNGTLVPAGVYLCLLKADNFVDHKKMLLLK